MSQVAIFKSKTAESKSKTAELEAYFAKYPDCPREVIVKEDCLRLGVRFTEAALRASEGYQLKSYYLFSFDQTKVSDMEKRESLRVPEDIKLVGGPYKLRPTVCAVRVNKQSPYLVDVVEGRLALCDSSEPNTVRPVADVVLRRAPKYYAKSLPDGTKYTEIAGATYWAYRAFVTALRNCHYWGDKEECMFCDINSNVRQQKQAGRPYTVHKKPEQVVEVLAAAFADESLVSEPGEYENEGTKRPHSFVLSGGTLVNNIKGKDDTDFYLQYIAPIKERIGNRPTCIVQGAAKDQATCKRLHDAGVNVHMFNFEVWDERLFKIICPGKERFVGREEWIKRTIDSVDILGESCQAPGMVAGVEMAQPWGFKTVQEAVRSTSAGFEFFMSHAVLPRPINWCIEPLSALGGQQVVPLDYCIQTDMAWYESFKKYGLPQTPGFGPLGPGRAVINTCAYADMGA